MSNSLAASFAYLLEQLLPGVRANLKLTSAHKLPSSVPGLKPAYLPKFGASAKGKDAFLWFQVPKREFAIIHLQRDNLPFSGTEKKLISFCAPCIKSLMNNLPVSRADRANLRIASRKSFLHLLISRMMRGSKYGNAWAPGIVLTKLEELALQKYENSSCRSGFIFLSNPQRSLATLGATGFDFTSLEPDLLVSEDFFDSPASHRYVDGRDSFFLIDKASKVHGVLRSRRPHFFKETERAVYSQILPLTKLRPSRCWAAFVGPNEDINVLFPDGAFARKLKARWRFVDKAHIPRVLRGQGISEKLSALLLRAALLISQRRLGTLILIPRYREVVPRAVAGIDSSPAGTILKKSIQGQSLERLLTSNTGLGVLTSDGICIVHRDGTMGDVGVIIEIAHTSTHEISGGGRTQAAISASEHGTVLKVSEDGPISIFDSGNRLLTLEL